MKGESMAKIGNEARLILKLAESRMNVRRQQFEQAKAVEVSALKSGRAGIKPENIPLLVAEQDACVAGYEQCSKEWSLELLSLVNELENA
jgi:hypothetical protein